MIYGCGITAIWMCSPKLTWSGELDLAPDAMHDEIEKNGIWILR